MRPWLDPNYQAGNNEDRIPLTLSLFFGFQRRTCRCYYYSRAPRCYLSQLGAFSSPCRRHHCVAASLLPLCAPIKEFSPRGAEIFSLRKESGVDILAIIPNIRL